MSTGATAGRGSRSEARSWRRTPIPALLLAGLLVAASGAQAQERGLRTVLLLNSYHVGFEWTDELVRGMRERLDEEAYAVDLRVEYLDSKRHDGEAYHRQFLTYLRERIAGTRIDLLITTDDAALQLVLDTPDLLPAVPLVFCGVNQPELAALARRARPSTGLREQLFGDEILDAMLALRPDTRSVYVVSDDSPTAKAQRRTFEAAAARRPTLTFKFLSGDELPYYTILRALEAAAPEDLVVTTAFDRDLTGQYYPRALTMQQIALASRAPVVSPSVSVLGQGLLAGSENSGHPHGRMAADQAAQVLRGVPPASLAVQVDSRQRLLIDYLQLARWGLSESRLPANAVVLNHPPSFYRANKALIWTGLGFMLVQSLVIAALVLNVRRRHGAETALAAKAAELAASNRHLGLLNQTLVVEQEERRDAEQRLRHAQKMEAVGQLAGGVAHDFNNLLTVIVGYSEIVLAGLEQGDPARASVDEIRRAAERASALTQQLLAFSRKQVLQPRVVNLNDHVADIEKMLRRLIGEDIELVTELATPLPNVLVDDGQIQQVLMNLIVNARDAMPGGGRVTIVTGAVGYGDQDAAVLPGLRPGQYVSLEVRDNGVGMDAETRARVFEPFFTTKGAGRGTGLGLSTVYGIVKQSGGWIGVESEPGRGAAFRILFPVCDRPIEPGPSASGPRRTTTRGTLVVVEDQADVRSLAAGILRREGYRVLEASNAREAFDVCEQHRGAIDLLVTDVVMPGMPGPELARRLLARNPALRVLYMSGYTGDHLSHRGAAEGGTAFLAKPFTPRDLCARVREVLASQ